MGFCRFAIVLLAACSLFAGHAVRADAPSSAEAPSWPVFAEIHILHDRVQVLLELDPAALSAIDPSLSLGPGAMSDILGAVLEIRDGMGRVLSARVRPLDPRRQAQAKPQAARLLRTAGGSLTTPEPVADGTIVRAEIDYPFDDIRPERLVLAPPLDPLGRARLPMGFLVYHQTVPVTEVRRLPGEVRLALSWVDPWRSRFTLPELARDRDDVLSHFLYVEREELRHEILVRLNTLSEWTDLGLADPRLVYAEEVEVLRERVAAFFAARNPLFADGRRLRPDAVETHIVRLIPGGVQLMEVAERVEAAPTVLGVILSYPIETVPEKVTVQWQLFSELIREVPAVTIDPTGSHAVLQSVDAPVMEWRGSPSGFGADPIEPVAMSDDRWLGVPVFSAVLVVLSLVCVTLAMWSRAQPRWRLLAMAAGWMAAAVLLDRVGVVEVVNPIAGLPDDQRAEAIVTQLVANLHHAAAASDEATRTRALAVSAGGEGLSRVSAEVGRALTLSVQGGLPARIVQVDNLVIEARGGGWLGSAFSVRASWRALGSAAHWGDDHTTPRMRFDAEIGLALIDGAWKVTSLRVRDAGSES